MVLSYSSFFLLDNIAKNFAWPQEQTPILQPGLNDCLLVFAARCISQLSRFLFPDSTQFNRVQPHVVGLIRSAELVLGRVPDWENIQGFGLLGGWIEASGSWMSCILPRGKIFSCHRAEGVTGVDLCWVLPNLDGP